MKKTVIFITVLLMIFTGCNKDEKEFASSLMELEPGTFTEEDFEKREKELLKEIGKFKKVLSEKIEAGNKLGAYYKMLGKLYMNNGMYKLALEEFVNAIEYSPENYTLYYHAGICSGNYGKTLVDAAEKSRYINDSLKYYQQALRIKSDYTKAMYGMAVVMIFETGDFMGAIPVLENLLTYDDDNYEAMFLLGNAYVSAGKISSAVKIYEYIASNAKNEEMQKQASENREKLIKGY